MTRAPDGLVRAPPRPAVWLVRATIYLVLAAPLLLRLNALRLTVLPDGAGSYVRLIAWELPVLVFLVALVEWSRRLTWRPGRLSVLAVAVVLWTILLADALVFQMFGLRLTFPDVVRYGTSARDVVAFLDLRVVVAAAAAAALALVAATRWRTRVDDAPAGGGGAGGAGAPSWRDPSRVALPVVAVLALLGASTLTPRDDADLYGWVYQNWVSLNTQNSLFTPYSAAFADSVRSAGELDPPCPRLAEPGDDPPSRPDVVVVLLESFSSGFSPLYGGDRSHLPELERISRDGLHFTRFLANGFTTEHGLIALLGGTLPVFHAGVDARSLAGYMAFSGFHAPASSLPACAAGLGYHTEFLTSGDLSFTDKGAWLRSIDFDRVEGHDAPRYDGLPRGMFGAVRDSVLYDRVVDRIAELRSAGEPYVLVVEGVDSHGPYRGSAGLRAALEGADADLGVLYDRLRAGGFLDSGLLVLVSDHRPQVPLSAGERERFGAEAAVRVPAVLVGRGVSPGEDTLPRHQLDLLPTVLHYITGVTDGPSGSGLAVSMLEPPPARCLPWLNAGRRDEVLALCPEGIARIRLDGDHTRVVDGEVSHQAMELISAIHRTRIAGALQAEP
jgi:lipoteichoic acid synthase